MDESYRPWSQDLFYSTEILIESNSESVSADENFSSPVRNQKNLSYVNLTPTRSPLQALQDTPVGLRYSPPSK